MGDPGVIIRIEGERAVIYWPDLDMIDRIPLRELQLATRDYEVAA